MTKSYTHVRNVSFLKAKKPLLMSGFFVVFVFELFYIMKNQINDSHFIKKRVLLMTRFETY